MLAYVGIEEMYTQVPIPGLTPSLKLNAEKGGDQLFNETYAPGDWPAAF